MQRKLFNIIGCFCCIAHCIVKIIVTHERVQFFLTSRISDFDNDSNIFSVIRTSFLNFLDMCNENELYHNLIELPEKTVQKVPILQDSNWYCPRI